MFIKKVILSTTIILCLGFISCKETNGPIIIPEEPEKFFEGPIIVSGSSSNGGDWIDPVSLRISTILPMSDIIFVGKTSKTEVNRIEVEITELIKGATNEKTVTLSIHALPMSFMEEGVDLFFICKDGDDFVYTTAKTMRRNIYSVIWLERGPGETYYDEIYDIKVVHNAYKKNKELFSKAGKQELFKLCPQLKGGDVKGRLFLDIVYLFEQKDIDKEDIPALLELRRIETSEWIHYHIDNMLKYLGWNGY